MLYEKAVRVRVQRPDREDCVEELQVRLALDQAQHQPSGSATIGTVSGLLARSDGECRGGRNGFTYAPDFFVFTGAGL